MDDQFVKVGDLLSLFSEESNGFVTTSGFAEIRVCMTKCEPNEATISQFQDAVFEVHAFKNYAALAAYNRALEMYGTDAGRPSRLAETDIGPLKRAMETESRNNESIQDRSLGQFVTYGQIIELKHVKSNKFLRVSEAEAAEGDKDALACTVDYEDEFSWFKIMPRYRLQSEGDRVHVGDKIVLLNVKTQHSLHTNPGFEVEEGVRFEVNGSTSPTGFKVSLYCSFISKELQDEMLNGGEIVRLYSKECDGYLMLQDQVDPENPDQQVPHILSSAEGRMSSNSLFRIEHTISSRGDLLKWEDAQIRLKHIGTGLYLAAGQEMPEKTAHLGTEVLRFFKLYLTASARGAASTFFLESLYPEEGEGYIKINSSFRIRSASTNALIHVLDERWEQPQDAAKEEGGMVGVQQAAQTRSKLCLCTKIFDEDSLVLVRVKDDEMTNINIVKGVVDLLTKFYKTMDEGQFPTAGDTKRVQRVLRDLIFFVQKVPEDKLRSDPLTLEEPVDNARQKVIKEQGIIDIVLDILRAPFDDKKRGQPLMLVTDTMKKPELKPYHYTCQLCYRLLKQVIKNNDECERYLSRPDVVNFMQQQLGYQLKTADTLMELFKDNRYLLDNLRDENILIFFQLIKDVGKLSRYMNFLNALVTCDGDGMPKNQEKICKMLLHTYSHESMIDFKLDGDVVVVDLESLKQPQNRKAPDWKPIHQFLLDGDVEQLNYFERLLTTMSNLCLGRNKECAEMVAQRLPYNLCFAIATHPQIKGSQLPIRAAIIRVIRTVYVDSDPHSNLAAINYTRVWGKLDRVDIPRRQVTDGSAPVEVHTRSKGKPVVTSLTKVVACEETIDLEPLKQFVKGWLDDCKSQVASEEAKNAMTLSVLELLSDLLTFGFFHNTDEINNLISALMWCLDGRDDLINRNDDHADNIQRYSHTASNLIIMLCKRKILSIFETIAHLRADFRLSMLLKVFKERFAKGMYQDKMTSKTLSSRGADLLSSLKDFGKGLGFQKSGDDKEIEVVFEQLKLRSSSGDFVEILEDCTKYEFDPLVQEAFRTLIRNFNQRNIMLEALRGTQLLVSDESERIHARVKDNCDKIMALMSSRMSADAEAITLTAMKDLEAIALKEKGVPNPVNQQILRSAGAHEVAHRLLRLPFSNDLPREQGRRDIFLSCYRFLLNFALKNAPNQAVLLKSVSFYMSQMGVKLKAADTLTEIFRDNRQVCSQIEESTVRHFVDIIANRGQFPRYLRFLQVIINPEGRPLKRNQDLVLKMLLKRHDDIFVLFSDPKGKAERNRLLSEKEHEKDPEGKIMYHTVLLSLMADIVGNHNQLAEAKCVSIIPFDECTGQLLDADCPDFIKASWIAFWRECYFEVERLDRSFDSEKQLPAVWQVLRALTARLEETVAANQVNADFLFSMAQLAETLYSKVFVAVSAANKEAPELTIKYANALVAAAASASRRESEATGKAIAAMKESRIAHKELKQIPDNFAKKEARKAKAQDTTDTSLELQIKKGFQVFITDYMRCTGIADQAGSREYQALVKIFMDDDPQRTESMPPSILDPSTALWGNRNTNTIKLITLLTGMRQESDLKRMCLRVLRDLAMFEDEDSGVTMRMSQNRLDKLGEYTSRKYKNQTFGATTMMLRMMCDPKHDDVLRQTLELGIALLEDGNEQVQDRVYKHFIQDLEGTLFEAIRENIRRGCEEIKERKAYELRKQEILDASDGTEEELRDSLPIFHERAHMVQLLRFIQLTCEGHNRKLQEYWRYQHFGVRSYDIVTEIANYLVELHSAGVDGKNIASITQCLETLTELMQGPCKGNQATLSTSKLPATCNKLLLQREFPGCSADETLDLHRGTAVVLCALLEGCRDNKVPINIANDFNFENVIGILTDLQKDAATEPEDSPRILCGYEMFCFLLTIREYVSEVKAQLAEHEATGDLSFFFEKTGHIEIAHDDDIERVFFPIPSICANLTERSRQEVLWTVDRSSPGKKVENFLDFADQLEEEMKHHEKLKANKFFMLFSQLNFDRHGTTSAFWVALIINMILFFHYTLPDDSDLQAALDARDSGCDSSIAPEEGGCPELNLGSYPAYIAPGWFGFVIFLGIILTLIELMRFVFFVMQFAKLIIRAGFIAQEKEQAANASKGKIALRNPLADNAAYAQVHHIFFSAYFLLHNTKFMSTLVLFVFGILGLAVSPLFFSVHLLNTVEMSIDLKNVLRAVTQNGKSLAITAIFGVMITYLFAIWGFISFREHYETDDGDLLCLSLFQCTITTLSGGLRKGDIGEIMSDTEWGNPGLIVFQLVFFSVVITIMLNIIFGIIIDTFGELRSTKAAIEDDMANNCFICSIDRYTFDRNTDGFMHHIKHEHNMWQYVYFLVYLHQKDPNNYTGAETFVDDLVQQNDASWFPINQAIKLMEHLAQEREEQTLLLQKVKDTASKTLDLDKKLDKLLNQQNDIANALRLGRGSQAKLREAGPAASTSTTSVGFV